jgi:hypothetical protein
MTCNFVGRVVIGYPGTRPETNPGKLVVFDSEPEGSATVRQEEYNEESLRLARIGLRVAFIALAFTIAGFSWTIIHDLSAAGDLEGVGPGADTSATMDQTVGTVDNQTESGQTLTDASAGVAPDDESEVETAGEVETSGTEARADDEPRLVFGSNSRLLTWIWQEGLSFWGAAGLAGSLALAYTFGSCLVASLLASLRVLNKDNFGWFSVPHCAVPAIGGALIAVHSYEADLWLSTLLALMILAGSLGLWAYSSIPIRFICDLQLPYREVSEEIEMIAGRLDPGRKLVFGWLTGQEGAFAFRPQVQQLLVECTVSDIDQAVVDISRLHESLPGATQIRGRFAKRRADQLRVHLSRIKQVLEASRMVQCKRDAAAEADAQTDARTEGKISAAAKEKAEAEAYVKAENDAKVGAESGANSKPEAETKAMTVAVTRPRFEVRAEWKERAETEAPARNHAWEALDPARKARVKAAVDALQPGCRVRFAVEGHPDCHYFFGHENSKYYFGQLDESGFPSAGTIWWAPWADVLNASVLGVFRSVGPSHEDFGSRRPGVYRTGTWLNWGLIRAANSRPRPKILV